MEPPKSGEACPNGDLKLVAHPRAKSKVWKYFGFDTDAEGCILQWKKIYCRICVAQIAYSGNTSNLSYHLEKNHPEEFCEFVKSNTEQMREAFATAFSKLKPEAAGIPAAAAGCLSSAPQSSSASPYSGAACISSMSPCPSTPNAAPAKASGADSRRHQELTAAVLRLVCEGLYPPSIVDEPTFRALLRTAEPRYEIPSRAYFSGAALAEKYAAVRAQVLRELAGAPWCGLSVDRWDSATQNRTYVTVAAHFLGAGCEADASPRPVSLTPGCRCLKTFEVPEENTAETVARVLYEAFVEWGIGSKVFGVTTDGSRDMLKACRLLDVSVQMPCLGHAFHAGMREALRVPQLAALLSRCSRLVDHFQRSSVAAYMLYEKQKQRRQPPRMLRSARATGWRGVLGMLRVLRENQFAVAAVLMEDSNSHHLMLDAAEWGTVDALADLLQPFAEVAHALSVSRYPAISTVKPVLHMLLSTTLRVKDTDAKELGLAKDILSKELSKTYQESPEVDMFLNVAAFLDPRYKRLPFLSAFERQQVENRVADEAMAVLNRLRDAPLASSPSPEKPACDIIAEEDATSPPAKKRAIDGHASVMHDMLAEIFRPASGAEDPDECQAQILEELSNYKSQKVLALAEDPLKWWSDRAALFPLLPTVLRKYWCVSATRAQPRRLFGSSATVLAAKRNGLAPAHVHPQVFLYENSRDGASEPEDEDEGEWGLEPEQVLGLGDPTGHGGGFAGTRDPGGPFA
ncbi:E3 SUMO-protein ligase ZBED1 [Suncus etruscus]|uniref:E3 SUMO-protein ligase ZBED1 n=1 Tax=Suncus etruscus TaxID=109475 RepID=UPI00210F5F49|nr:E3 SUMO-protein ligase ZBED1 [Suncus etruscus]